MTRFPTRKATERIPPMERWLEQHRRLILETAWMVYMAFSIIGYPYFGVSVMLPSILLCGLAAWLFPYRIALLTAGLTLPYHMLVMMYNFGNPQAWHAALEPGGLAAQVLAISFISISKSNRNKTLELSAGMKGRIKKRTDELQEIADFMEHRAETEYARMSDQLCNVVDNQLTALLYHSETLRNFLTFTEAPHADKAIKLVAIAEQNIEQVKTLHKRLSAKSIQETGLDHAIRAMCTYLSDTVGTRFSISISEQSKDVPEKHTHTIYRIAHEAVTNALKHGKATHIDIQLNMDAKTFSLTVSNNGLPLEDLNSDGIGLQLMQQQAKSIGATVRYTKGESNRTVFNCTSR